MTIELSLFEESTDIEITRKIIRIEGEVYQFSNVTGFSFQKLEPERISIQKESTLPWLILLSSSILYVFLLSTPINSSDIYTLLAYILIVISIVRIVQIEGSPSSRIRLRYGLILILNSGSSIIFPSYNKDAVIKTVTEIYKFMKEENDRESIIIHYEFNHITNIGELSFDQSQRIQNFNAPMSGIIGSEIKDNAQVYDNKLSQHNNVSSSRARRKRN